MKVFLKIVLVLVLVVVGLAVGAYFYAGTLIRTGTETAGPKFLGVPVTLRDADLALFSGRAQLKGLTVGNPEGFKTPHAFNLGGVSVRMIPRSVFSDRIVIEEILVEAPNITYELAMGGSNLGAILKTIESKAPPADTEAPPAEPEPPQAAAAEGKKVQINHLIVRDGRIGLSATLLGGSQATIPLPEIHLKDIGKEKDGASVPEVVAQVSRALFGAIGQAVAGSGKLLGKGADLAGDALIGGVKAAGDIADEGVKVLGDAAGAAADTAAQAAGKSVDMAADAGKAVAGAGKAVVGGAGKTVTGAGKAVVGGATGAGKAVTGAAADAGKAVGSAVGKTTGKLVGGMKSLLGGRKEPPPADPNEDTEEQGEE